MKYITTLFIALSVALHLSAEPEIVSATQINPPVDWKIPSDFSRISAEPWVPAFLALKEPEETTFSEWTKYFSDAVKAEKHTTEVSFKEMVDRKIKAEKTHSIQHSIRTVIRFKNDGKEYTAVLVVNKFGDKFQNEVLSVLFFTLNGDHFINSVLPTDIPFDSPIYKFDFSTYLNPPLKPAYDATKK